MRTLDRYHMMIVAKYFLFEDDFIKMTMICKKFKEVNDMFHFNPIPVSKTLCTLFPHIETQNIYNFYDPILPSAKRVLFWAQIGNKRRKMLLKRYPNIEFSFKRLMTGTPTSDEFKDEHDVFVASASYFRTVKNGVVDFSHYPFVGCPMSVRANFNAQKVVLSPNLRTIQKDGWSGFGSVREIDLSHVTRLKSGSISYCGFTSLTLSTHLEVIEDKALFNLYNLKNVVIDGDLTDLDITLDCYKTLTKFGVKVSGRVWCDKQTIRESEDIKVITPTYFNGDNKTLPIKYVPANSFFNEQKMTKLILPTTLSEIRGFDWCNKLQEVNLPFVTRVDKKCFANCVNLTSASLPKATHIGSFCFDNCAKLAVINLCEHLDHLSRGTFAQCTALTSLKLPDALTSMGKNIFNTKKQEKAPILQKMKLPTNLRKLEKWAVSVVDIPEVYVVPKGLFKIGKGAFTTQKIREFVVKYNDVYLGKNLFAFNTTLQKVVLEQQKHIGMNLFFGCVNLKEVVLSDVVESIGKNAFRKCEKLSQIRIGSGVKYIESNAFNGCTSLDNITFCNSNVKIAVDAFKGCHTKNVTLETCDKLKVFNGRVCYDMALMMKANGVMCSVVEFTRDDRRTHGSHIPEIVTRLGVKCFEGCTNEVIEVPNKVTKIGFKCFNKCKKLKKVVLSKALFDETTNTLLKQRKDQHFIGETVDVVFRE
ncbi:hypothetical protein EIN_116730 [Entamoeba invadens IP1]|uniref:Leucine rich repeat containing protein BspA family protein n=1 Tax=Entamoeba invadens IP1 TaxID=370355 RepID=L7FNH2_ENTIV|nr:hypothetical protein EIN_116730 [Entamoeba invadens IP1]ELP94542.1 hypothetical protein EIN_116730 [Entamoeba invadens IP1]|eukprot:XP_004261313.1 hypothetical protein EIN_116730 [Entamoeba invadens IP1]